MRPAPVKALLPGLDYHNLCIDPQYVFLDRMTGKAFFLYIPEASARNTDEEILQFFKDTFGYSQITGDNAFQVRLFQYFSKNQVTLNGLYRLFLEESKKVGSGSRPGGRQRGADDFAGIRQENGAGWKKIGAGAEAGDTSIGNNTAEQKEARGMPWGVGDSGHNGKTGERTSKIPDTNPSSAENLFGQKPSSGIFGAKENGAKAAETSGKESGIGKLGGLMFGGGKGKKEKGVLPGVEADGEDALVFGAGEANEVVAALFGDRRKEQKKEQKEKAAAGRDRKSGGRPEKRRAGGFLPFGKKKEADFQTAETAYGHVCPSSSDASAAIASADVAGQYELAAASFQEGGEGEQTEIADEMLSADAFLELIDSPIAGAPFRIELDFETSYITIGRRSSDEIQPDVAFGREFLRIGRRHARIEKRDGHYHVIDLGSANHTLLDGQVLIPNQPYALKDGGELTFTDSRPVRYRIHL